MQAAIYRKLTELVERFRVEKSPEKGPWVKRLFETLAWDGGPFSIEPDEGGFKLLIDSMPVANVVTAAPSNVTAVYSALNRAYNEDVPWVIASDFRALGLFGAYWVSFEYDVSAASALHLNLDDYLLDLPQLELLTPVEVSRNRLDELYKSYTGRKTRIPIDIHLMNQMAAWRNAALEAIAEDVPDADSLVYKLINALFLVRYLEDSAVISFRESLLELVNLSDEEVTKGLTKILGVVAQRTGYKVLSRECLKPLSAAPLKRLIRELYGYPEWGVKYDFAALSSDILGRFYEEYLRFNVENAKTYQREGELFEQQSVMATDIRKSAGIFYTPRFLVEYIITRVLDRYQATGHTEAPCVADLAAGSGTFLSVCIDHLLDDYASLRDEPNRLTDSLIGFDIDTRAIEAARLNLTAKLLSREVETPLPELKFFQFDVLKQIGKDSRPPEPFPACGVDIIVGNPPYISYETLVAQYEAEELKSRFETAGKRFDSYILFLEAATRCLKPGGICGFVLPVALFNSKSAALIREWLTIRADLLEIVDFRDQSVFRGVAVYVCVLIFRKRIESLPKPKVTVAKVHSLSATPSSQLASISVTSGSIEEGIEVFFTDQPVGRGAWVFRNAIEVGIMQSLQKVSEKRLRDVIELKQGIKTGADSIFVVEARPVAPGANIFCTGSGPSELLESGVLRPILRNRGLKRWAATPSEYIIFPYEPSGKLIPWGEFKKRYPNAAHYLEKRRAELKKRKSISNKLWYEIARARTEAVFDPRQHFFMPELSFRPLASVATVEKTTILGSTGGGSWVFLKDDSISVNCLLAYLNSAVTEWLLRQECPVRAGGYMLLEHRHLEELMLPNFLFDENSYGNSELERLGKLLVQASARGGSHSRGEIEVMEQAVNGIILSSIGLTTTQASYIQERLTSSRSNLLATPVTRNLQ